MSAWRCGDCGNENSRGIRLCARCGASMDEAAQQAPPSPHDSAISEGLRGFLAKWSPEGNVESDARFADERRLVTAVFADISGYSALADQLDPEQLADVIDPVITALAGVVGRYDGCVNKFAGDALLCLFGAPVSHEEIGRASCRERV